MKNIVFLGAPGSGKGTQSAFLIRDYEIVQISTGDILRAAVKEGSELGRKAKEFMDAGKLVTDELIIDIVKERLFMDDCRNGFILDGFPRTAVQADALDEMLRSELDTEITHVISLEVPDEVLYERITGRRSCPKCGRVYHIKFFPPKKEGICDADGTELVYRDDDNEETLKKRLNVFHESTAMLKVLYGMKGILKIIEDGTKPADEIYKEIKSFVDDLS
jgi:adenylate kinase